MPTPSRARAWRRLAVLPALLIGACSHPAAVSAPPVRNLVIVSLDTLRADRLGCYGYPRPTTPNLDAFASTAALFTQATATSPWTKPSHASLFTGLYPHRNGVLGFEYGFAPGTVTLAELLAARGFQTAAIVSNTVLAQHDLKRGFEHFDLVERGPGPEPTHVTPRALAWLRGRDRSRPFFAFVHYNDAHADYRALPQFQERFVKPYEGMANGKARQLFAHVMGLIHLDAEDARHLSDLYDAAVSQLDAVLGPLFEFLASEELLESTLVIVLSDHGEEFLEHGGFQHGLTQYEESVRIPLLVRAPSIRPGTRVDVPVSLVDVVPTCLALLELETPDGLDGLSFVPLWSGGELPERSLVMEADCAVPALGSTGPLQPGQSRALRRGRFKLHLELDGSAPRLFDLESDPGEQVDVSAEHAQTVHALGRELAEILRNAPEAGARETLSEDELARLRELGYTGDGD